MRRLLSLLVLIAALAAGQGKRVLYVTHSAGYRHEAIPTSIEVLRRAAAADRRLEIVATEDVSQLNAATLRGFDAVLFFTSGELPITDLQKESLLEFVRAGKGFGGVHSATDTLYGWAEYGELIGARFRGHPWTQVVRVDVEDGGHPAMAHLGAGFRLMDEIYQFAEFSRERVRVLLTLDTHTVDLGAGDVNPGTTDFPLAWCREFGAGRSFYTALGHFESTWRDERFVRMMVEALLWLTRQTDGDARPRVARRPVFTSDGVGNSATFQPRGTVAPGSLISIYGADLTVGGAASGEYEFKLAGTSVKANGVPVPLLYASPSQVNALLPLGAGNVVDLELRLAGEFSIVRVAKAASTPGIFTYTGTREWVTLWATGLGGLAPVVEINGVGARVTYSGPAPGWPGLDQVNVEVPAGSAFPARLVFRLGGFEQVLRLEN